MKKTILALLATCGLALHASVQASTASAAAIDQPFLDKLIQKSSVSSVAISQNGKYYSFLGMGKNGLRTLIIKKTSDDSTVTFVNFPNANIANNPAPQWVSGENIIYRVTKLDGKGYGERGDLNVFNLNVETKKKIAIWGNAKGKVRGSSNNNKLAYLRISHSLPNDPEHVLTQITTREKAPRVQVYKFDTLTGDSDFQVQTKLRGAAVATNINGTHFVASGKLDDYSDAVEYYAPGKGWQPLAGFDNTTQTFTAMQLSMDGTGVYGELQEKGSIDNPIQFVLWDAETGNYEELLSYKRATAESIKWDITNMTPVYITTNEGGKKTHYLQPGHRLSKMHKRLSKQFPEQRVTISSNRPNHDMAVARVSSGSVPADAFFVDLKKGSAQFKFAALDQFAPSDLTDSQYVSWPSFDGVEISGWFAKPKNTDKPPLVVLIHGGPHGPYDRNSYDPWIQFLTHHGYAVLKVNYRGSGGEGPNFEALGYGEWGRGMLDDVRAGAEYLQASGQVDAKRVCSMGFSYGGYATAMNMVRHADFYKCGIIGGGVFSFEQQMKTSDIRNLTFGDSYQMLAYGPKQDWNKYSSLARANEIISPIILFHGREDRRTPFKGVLAFEKALKKAGVDYEKHWWPHEGHGLAHDKTQQNYYENSLKFLAKNL